MLYIYDIDLNLVGTGSRFLMESSNLMDYYLAEGFIISTSLFDIVDF